MNQANGPAADVEPNVPAALDEFFRGILCGDVRLCRHNLAAVCLMNRQKYCWINGLSARLLTFKVARAIGLRWRGRNASADAIIVRPAGFWLACI